MLCGRHVLHLSVCRIGGRPRRRSVIPADGRVHNVHTDNTTSRTTVQLGRDSRTSGHVSCRSHLLLLPNNNKKEHTHTHSHKKNNTFLGVTPFFHKSTRRGCLYSARGRQPAQTCKNTAHTHTSSTPRCKRDGEYRLKLMRYACDTTHYGSQTDGLCLDGPGPGTILPFLRGRRLYPSLSYSFPACSLSLALTHAHRHPYFVLPSYSPPRSIGLVEFMFEWQWSSHQKPRDVTTIVSTDW